MHVLTLLALISIALPYLGYCFCIYNDYSDDTSFLIRQVGGYSGGTIFSRFKFNIVKPGESRCCSFKNKGCVGGLNEYHVVKFYIKTFSKDKDLEHFEITCPGGGTLVLSGTEEVPDVNAYFADGKPFLFERNNNGHTVWLYSNLNKTREDKFD